MKKMYAFYVSGIGEMIGDSKELNRAYERYGYAKVFVSRSWMKEVR